MIILDRVTKVTKAHGCVRKVLTSVDAVIPSDRRVALLSHLNDDTRILLDLLAGLVMPTAGRIRRKARVSFPVGYLEAFNGELSVRHNVAHIARLYGADVAYMLHFVERLAGIKLAFDRPFRELPLDARRRLSQIVGYSIPFDVYLLNAEPTRAAGAIGQVSRSLFEARSHSCGMVIPTRDVRFAEEHCDMGMILFREQLWAFDDVTKAFRAFENLSEFRYRPPSQDHQ